MEGFANSHSHVGVVVRRVVPLCRHKVGVVVVVVVVGGRRMSAWAREGFGLWSVAWRDGGGEGKTISLHTWQRYDGGGSAQKPGRRSTWACEGVGLWSIGGQWYARGRVA